MVGLSAVRGLSHFLPFPAAAATSYRPDGEVDLLTKGDNNPVDDRGLYPPGQLWLNERHIIGRAKGYPPTTQLVLLVWLLVSFALRILQVGQASGGVGLASMLTTITILLHVASCPTWGW